MYCPPQIVINTTSPIGIMSLQDVVQCQEQSAVAIDEITSAQILEFCETDIFPETTQISEVTCSSDCCYHHEDNNSTYTTTTDANIPLPPSNASTDLDENFSCHRDIKPLQNVRANNYYNYSNNIKDDRDNKINNKNNTTAAATRSTTPTTSGTTIGTTPITIATTNHNYNSCCNMSIIFDSSDETDNDISASIDFSPTSQFPAPVTYFPACSTTPTTEQDYLDLISSVQLQASAEVAPLSSTDAAATAAANTGHIITQFPPASDPLTAALMMPPTLGIQSMFKEDCTLSSIPSFVQLNSTSSHNFMDPPAACMRSFLPSCSVGSGGGGIYGGGGSNSSSTSSSMLVGAELQSKNQLVYQGCPADQLPRLFNSADIQGLSNIDSQQQRMVSEVRPASSSALPLATEISGTAFEDPTFKVGKLSVEQRKEKIHRYLKKRNERNFNKKIKYACRKTLADSRPRVRGRFAKNDDFGDNHHRQIVDHPHHHLDHEDDDYDDIAVNHVKADEDHDHVVDSSDIFAHISGVNSFKYGYTIESWI